MKLEHILQESSDYTKLRQYIFGTRDMGAGIAIVTPQNPMGGAESHATVNAMSRTQKLAYAQRNNELYADGEDLLKKVLYKRYFKQKGIFEGQEELSFVIVDVSFQEAVKISRRWKQTAVIWISQEEDGYVLRYVDTNVPGKRYEVQSLVRRIFSSEAADNISIIGGRKYVIPFFDEREERINHRNKKLRYPADKVDPLA